MQMIAMYNGLRSNIHIYYIIIGNLWSEHCMCHEYVIQSAAFLLTFTTHQILEEMKRSSLLHTPSLKHFCRAPPTSASLLYRWAQSMCLYPAFRAASTAAPTSPGLESHVLHITIRQRRWQKGSILFSFTGIMIVK